MLLDDAKLAIRMKSNTFDTEITDLLEAARLELIQAGISSEIAKKDDDPLIKRALITYVKANFGFDNPDYEKFAESFISQKRALSLSGDYNAV